MCPTLDGRHKTPPFQGAAVTAGRRATDCAPWQYPRAACSCEDRAAAPCSARAVPGATQVEDTPLAIFLECFTVIFNLQPDSCRANQGKEMQVRMRQHLTLQHPRRDVRRRRPGPGTSTASRTRSPSISHRPVQRTKARTSERGLRAVVALVQVHAAVTAGMRNTTAARRPRQPASGCVRCSPNASRWQVHGAGQVSRHQQTNRPRRQAAEEFGVPLEEQPKIHRCATRERDTERRRHGRRHRRRSATCQGSSGWSLRPPSGTSTTEDSGAEHRPAREMADLVPFGGEPRRCLRSAMTASSNHQIARQLEPGSSVAGTDSRVHRSRRREACSECETVGRDRAHRSAAWRILATRAVLNKLATAAPYSMRANAQYWRPRQTPECSITVTRKRAWRSVKPNGDRRRQCGLQTSSQRVPRRVPDRTGFLARSGRRHAHLLRGIA